MDDIVNVHEAKTHLSRLLARVEAGEEITLARGGTPIARIVPIRTQRAWAGPGAWRDYGIPDDVLELTPEEEREREALWNGPIFPDDPEWEAWICGRGPKPA